MRAEAIQVAAMALFGMWSIVVEADDECI